MNLAALRVIHLPKGAAWNALAAAGVHAQAREDFFVDTCQRQLWIGAVSIPDERAAEFPEGVDVFEGKDAYRFLLQVSTGLESQVQGETDIFGQIKEGWTRFRDQDSVLARELSPWVQRLFEDTKEIRTRFMRFSGGASYGSLVRKLLKRYEGEPILIVGAGQIARAIAPWLAENELWLLNRSLDSARALEAELLSKVPKARIRILSGEAEEVLAWTRAAHAVVCIPANAREDERRIGYWKMGLAEATHPKSVLHLGVMRGQAAAWLELPNFHPLDDLFEIQKQAGDARSHQFLAAFRACEEKAQLRALGGPTGAVLPHGWEDLAAFT